MPVEIIPAPVQPEKPKPGGPIQSTSGRVITHPPLQWATIYAPDGAPHHCSPVDAREILAAGIGYTLEPPEVVDEQPREQQPVNGDIATAEANSGASSTGVIGDSNADGGASGGGHQNRRTRQTRSR